MGPERFGRTLGIGVRVASNILRDRAGRLAQGDAQAPVSSPAPAPVNRPRVSVETLGQAAARTAAKTGSTSRAIGHGSKKFGQAFWIPFRNAGRTLWLEITGLFFALFAVFFTQNVYRTREAWNHGPEHSHFLLYLAFAALFAWFSVSSFLKANKKTTKDQRG
jgi:hypothetical protein